MSEMKVDLNAKIKRRKLRKKMEGIYNCALSRIENHLRARVQGIDVFFQGCSFPVGQLHVWLEGNDVDVDGGQESQGPVAPRDGREEVGVIVTGAGDHGSVGHDHLVSGAKTNLQ